MSTRCFDGILRWGYVKSGPHLNASSCTLLGKFPPTLNLGSLRSNTFDMQQKQIFFQPNSPPPALWSCSRFHDKPSGRQDGKFYLREVTIGSNVTMRCCLLYSIISRCTILPFLSFKPTGLSPCLSASLFGPLKSKRTNAHTQRRAGDG
jgi:hypothetical protein